MVDVFYYPWFLIYFVEYTARYLFRFLSVRLCAIFRVVHSILLSMFIKNYYFLGIGVGLKILFLSIRNAVSHYLHYS